MFRSEFFFRTTHELEYLFCLCAKHEFFFQNLTLGYMTKTLNQIIFFSSTKIRIFFSATLGIRIFFYKKTITPPGSLNGPSLRGCCGLDCMMDGYTSSYSTWVISTNYNCPGALNKTFGNKVCFYRLIAGWWFPPRSNKIEILFKMSTKINNS
jgi:hypothetical protein